MLIPDQWWTSTISTTAMTTKRVTKADVILSAARSNSVKSAAIVRSDFTSAPARMAITATRTSVTLPLEDAVLLADRVAAAGKSLSR